MSNSRSSIIRTGFSKPTIAGCVEGMKVDLGLAKVKKPRKQRATGMKYDRREDVLRKEIIKALRKIGCRVFRLEPSYRGKWGVSDLMVFSRKYQTFSLIEVKSPTGYVSYDQIKFRDLCWMTNTRYFVVRSVADALTAVAL